jgi:thioredoxin reductase (NADPH)
MTQIAGASLASRRDQMFPTLTPADLGRMRRFGEPASYEAGDYVVRAGSVSPGLIVVASGRIEVTQDGLSEAIVTHGPGNFSGELAQLSSRPSLVDARAIEPVEAHVIPSRRLRDLMIQEADLGERIMRALILRRVGLLESGAGGPIVVGQAGSGDVLRLQTFLTRSGLPYRLLDSDGDPCGQTLVSRFHVDPHHLPIVLCSNGKLLLNPSDNELARCIGLVRPIDPATLYDIAIVGAGPAGLAAAMYAASEGLTVLVVDCRAFGGQAGASMRIENYLGFPTGISGMALMARAYNQALKFGVETAIPDEAVRLGIAGEAPGAHYLLRVGEDETASTRAIVIATGVRYRRLDMPNLAEFEGTCVHYWASPIEARLCEGQEVALVGAGNSAGQAAVYLSSQVRKVWILARGKNLAASMSRYLVERIEAQPNIEVVTEAVVSGLEGRDGQLDAIRWARGGEEERCPIRHLFLFIGADPNTDWLQQSGIALDAKGFVETGANGTGRHPLETNRPGVFSIGDVRSGSIKRVAAAVGEGAQVVAALHVYLASTGRSPLQPT